MASQVTGTATPQGGPELTLKAENLIKNHVMAAGGFSLVPLPLLDLAAITVVQVRMIQKLAAMYGKTFSEKPVRNTIIALAGGVVGQGAGATAAFSLTKFIPGFGWMIGLVSMPVVVGATTYAIGHVFLRHFEQGGSVYDMSVESARGYYKEQMEKGKKLAAAAKASVHKRTAPTEQPA
jgi:uncharacterized protein (DUF697 family)